MKSAKERADTILRTIWSYEVNQEHPRWVAMVGKIAAEIEAYAEESFIAGRDQGARECRHAANIARSEGRRAGRLEAIEEAAKVAERCIEHYSKDEPMVVLHSNVFKMIRALKESEI